MVQADGDVIMTSVEARSIVVRHEHQEAVIEAQKLVIASYARILDGFCAALTSIPCECGDDGEAWTCERCKGIERAMAVLEEHGIE